MRGLISLLAALGFCACKVYDPLYCDKSHRCSDPERPFCDLHGEYPASEGIAKTCIPVPTDGSPVDPPDGGLNGGSDGATDAHAERFVVDLAVASHRTCAVLNDGGLRCWGSTRLLDGVEVGDDDQPFEIGDIPTGGSVKQVALGEQQECVLYDRGNVRCVGNNSGGVLGYGHTLPVGPLAEAGDVPLGEPAKQIVAGLSFTCALLESGAIRCWGLGTAPLGYGDGERTVGDDETPADKPPIEIGGAAVSLAAGRLHMCATLAGGEGRVRCWGTNLGGELGYGNRLSIGDDEHPATAGDVPIGAPVASLLALDVATCAVLTNRSSKCWGAGITVLGYSDSQNWGDDEPVRSAPDLALGGVALDIAGGPKCALMSDHSVRCWGINNYGQLGYGHTNDVGEDGDLVSSGPVQLGGLVAKIARGRGETHACVLLMDGSVRCWGWNLFGELGLGHRETIGDDELPIDVPAVRVLE